MLATVAIVGLLAALMFPQVKNMATKSKMAKSMANLRTIGVGVNMYLNENNGLYPLSNDPSSQEPFWTQKVSLYLPEARGGWKDLRGDPIVISPALMDPLLPNGQHGPSVLGDYGVNTQMFGRSDQNQVSAASISRPASMVTVMTAAIVRNGKEVGAWWVDGDWYVYGTTPSFPTDRGTGSILCLFGDGHTEEIKKAEFEKNKANLLLRK